MGDGEKPFACNEPGCNMTFTNEDHLNVHTQKHKMSLALNSSNSFSIAGFMFADQTPTPTKFLKNCDDIGLFQELSKNPFEESFKKAAIIDFPSCREAVDNVDTPILPQREDDLTSRTSIEILDSPPRPPDLLRTPSITVTDTTVSSAEETVLLPTTSTGATSTIAGLVTSSSKQYLGGMSTFTDTVTQARVGSSNQTMGVLSGTIVKEGVSFPILFTLPTGEAIPIQIPGAIINPNVPVPLAVQSSKPSVTKAAASSTSALTKQKLKEAITQNVQNNILKDNMRVMSEAVEQVTAKQNPHLKSDPSPATTPDSEVGTTTTISRRRCSSASLDEDDSKRQKFLERNRAAAQRCRDKRKKWIVNLEDKSNGLSQTNIKLQNEVMSLREEVATLKSVLLAHKDCPVTRQQQAQGQFLFNGLMGSSATQPASSTVTQPFSQNVAEAIATSALSSLSSTDVQTIPVTVQNVTVIPM